MRSVQRPYGVSHVDPTSQITCIGKTKRGLRCKNKIADESGMHAEILLRQCENLSSNSPLLKENLWAASGLLLCGKRHQPQQSDIYKKWLKDWPTYGSETDSAYGSDEGEDEDNEQESIQNLRGRSNRQFTRSGSNGLRKSISKLSPFEACTCIILQNQDVDNDAKVSLLRDVVAFCLGDFSTYAASDHEIPRQTQTVTPTRRSQGRAATRRPSSASLPSTSTDTSATETSLFTPPGTEEYFGYHTGETAATWPISSNAS